MIQKKLLILMTLLISMTAFSQVIGYDDAGLLFSRENIKGTSRYTAMSGAFGALGGDLSAADVNPAGLAIFKYSESTLTLDSRSTDIISTYYNTATNNSDDRINFAQAGGVIIFDNGSDMWSKFALGVNYTIVNDFTNGYVTNGNSQISEFNVDPFLNFDNDDTNDIFYNNVESQRFINNTSGSNDKVTFTIAGQYDDDTSFGFSVITHSLDYFQHVRFNEVNNDGNANVLDAQLDQRLLITGEGIGFGFGVISKSVDNFRFGASFETPTWYELTEEFEESTNIQLSNTATQYNENPDINIFDYRVKTPLKLTGSFAYIFGKAGLISFDYVYKDYSSIKIKPSSEFNTENQTINDNLTSTGLIKVGAEFRHKNLSFRGGFHTEDSPIKSSNEKETGYSLGLGIKFSESAKLDFSYDKTTAISNYQFISTMNPTELDTTNDRLSITLTIGL
jgi:hypothetical protein